MTEIIFIHQHNWANQTEEHFEYGTDIIPIYEGFEQRISYRAEPRTKLLVNYTLQGDELRILKNKLKLWTNATYLVPESFSSVYTVSSVSVDADTYKITVPDRGHFKPGEKVFIGDKIFNLFESPTVTTYAEGQGSIDLVEPLGDEAKEVMRIRSIQRCKVESQPQYRHITSDTADIAVTFDYATTSLLKDKHKRDVGTYYAGYPVLTLKPNRANDLTETAHQVSDVFDPGTGAKEVDHRFEYRLYQWTWDLVSSEVDEFKRLMNKCRGAQGQFFAETYNVDAVIVKDIDSTDLSIDIVDCDFSLQDLSSRFIAITTNYGTVHYKRVLDAWKSAGGVETLSISTALGVAVKAADVERVSYLESCRFGSDKFAFKWTTDNLATITKNLRTVKYQEVESV